MRKEAIVLLAIGVAAFAGCIKPPSYPNEPVIEYVGVNKNTVTQGNAIRDTLAVRFSFTDGDGDISFPGDSLDLYFRDNRTNFTDSMRLPFIPQESVNNGISGEVTVLIPNTFSIICCIPPNGAPPCTPNIQFPTDTFYYFIQMRDRAGNISNEIQTDSIVILCN